MKRILYLAILILVGTSLTRCSDEDTTFGEGLPRELKLNTISYMAEVGNSLVVAGRQDFGSLAVYKLNKNFGTVWMKSNFSPGVGSLIKACYDQRGNMILFISVAHEGTSLRASSVLSVYSNTVLIITLNPSGDEINRVKIGAYALSSVAQTADHGYLLFGSKLLRLRADFTTVWENNDVGYTSPSSHISRADDKGFVVTGGNNDQVFLRKYNKNGDAQWVKNNFNATPLNDVGFDVRLCGTSGFVIAGRTLEPAQPLDVNCFIIRTNSEGDTLWTKKFGTSAREYLDQILYASADEVIVKEQFRYPNDPARKTFLVRLTQDGQITSTKETDNFDKMIFTRSGYFIKAKKIGDKQMLLTRVELAELFSQ